MVCGKTRPTHVLFSLGALAFEVHENVSTRHQFSPSAAAKTEQQVFDRIGHVRELRDGTLLVTDASAKALFVVPPEGPTRKLGRTGDGPGEYRGPGRLIPLGDSNTVLVDNRNRRWQLLQLGAFRSLPDAFRDVNFRVRGDLGGISRNGVALDVQGRGAAKRMTVVIPRNHPLAYDSIAFVLQHGRVGADTVALGRTHRLGAATKRVVVNGLADVFIAMHPLATYDQGVLFPDGSVAIARVEPYRVDWRASDGTWQYGQPMQEVLPAVTARVRADLARRISSDAQERPVFSQADFKEWPARVPAFTSYSVHAGSDGRVYIVRTDVGSTLQRQVDIFERERGRVGSVNMPAGTRLVGLGRRTLFAARTLDTGEEEIVRVPILPFAR